MKLFSHRLYVAIDGAWRRRYLIVVPIFILPFVGLAIGMLSPKNYASHTTMLVQETAKMNPFLEDLAVSAMIKERMAALDTLLHSRFILNGVAESQGLVNENTSPAERDRIINKLSSSLTMKIPGKDLIRIDYKASRPEGMKDMLESVTHHFVEQLMAPERSSMTDSTAFLVENLEVRRQELEAAETALARFRSENAAQLPELHSSTVSRLAELKQRLTERQALLAGAKKNLGGIGEQLSKTNPVLSRLEEQIVRIRGELALLLARYTDKHSKVQSAQRTLNRLESERAKVISDTQSTDMDPDKLWAIASNTTLSADQNTQPLLVSQLESLQATRGKVDSLSEEVLSLTSSIEHLQSQISQLGEKEQQLTKLERDLKVKRKLYENLLERHEMARLTGSLGLFEREKRIKLIDRPFTPSGPTNLPVFIFIIAGIFGGLFLGIGLAVIAELSDSTVRRKSQLALLANAPVITRLPHWSS
ncbi:chain-length determining protein [Alteromonas sediminis]|uniref:Chain-length determining protein n=1 Tax=Alteromonas sediminis TaxID=2259342 RepID=A0A3N5Y5U2_9ALTE|nr:chain-length determining protein [Alteromonas sediminis]RPJ68576.1 chain-length determining protein [Alteromonas sediminis]